MENKDEIIKNHITRIKNEQNSLTKNALIINLETFLRIFKANISDDVRTEGYKLIKTHTDESGYEDVSRDIASDPNCQKGKNRKGCVMQGGRKKRSLSKRSKSKKSKKNSKRSKKLKRSRGGSKKNSKRSKNNKKKN